ncbi:signal transduction histidine kinase [Ostreococcus tauri]|uniref:Signal transduction histidine kinase n=1 Tax=Ostreococcus tauri TaxID=70448 RepID=A0A1Y5IKN2_OSTTA|nr:signal transduction histidine kinase [Ostreococcus tauri]
MMSLARTTSTASRPQEADLFAKYALSHCEAVARAVGESDDDDGLDARAMIYLRGPTQGSSKMRLTRIASWPPKPSNGSNFSGDWDVTEEEEASAIDWDAPEETLAAQKTFELPSANAVVACLCFEESLVGIIVVERTSRAADVAEAFSSKQKQFLESAANAFTDAWAIHRNNVLAAAAAYRADQKLGVYLYESRQPLNALRTLGGMLKIHLKPDDPAGDMAEAMVQQGDALAELSRQLESVLYPNATTKIEGVSYRGGGAQQSERKREPLLLTDDNALSAREVSVGAMKDDMCDITKVLVTLLATSDVVATSGGLTVRATLPEGDAPAIVSASPLDVRSALAEIIDVALVVSPPGSTIDVLVDDSPRAQTNVVDVALNVDASNAGMRIARRLVEKVGGRFAVDNDESGNYLTIRVRYPKDELRMTRRRLSAMPNVTMGGRVAEELIIGSDEITL